VVRESRNGALVISLDFELMWGVRDRPGAAERYMPNLRGARVVVPRLLEMFEEFQVAATWATVGFLFARSRAELEEMSPSVRPCYEDVALDPYGEVVGENEGEDPLHFAPSLVDQVHASPGQEIATHTFSHYYCGEAGQSADTFRADLLSACKLAESRGIRIRSIVFPRNQHNPAYDQVLSDVGIHAYRGNPRSRAWGFTDAGGSRRVTRRVTRLLDNYAGRSAGTFSWDEVAQPGGLSDVRASCFLPALRPALRSLESLRFRRLRNRIRSAARTGTLLHLWWHPHNFGIHQEENLSFLRRVLIEFSRCRDEHGMESLSMAGVHDRIRSVDHAHLPRGPSGREGDPP
jgi:peptidoglycan/xylan/chitin deacetylase (PgdA/CDA1 family)